MKKSSSTPYAAYWRTYPTEAEANEQTKKQWSPTCISAGIVSASMAAVARNFSGRGREQPEPREVTKNLISTTGELFWHQLRVHIYGLVAVRDEDFLDLSNELRDQARESLCLCIIPESRKVSLRVDPGLISSNALFLHPDDVDALARGEWQIDELIEFKFYRAHYLDKPNTETQFDERLVDAFRENWRAQDRTWLKSEEALRAVDDVRGWVRHPLVDRVVTSVQRDRPCLLIGASSSGKTILALEAADQLSRLNFDVSYLNLGTIPGKTPIALSLVADTRPHSVLVIDDLQSNPQAAKYLALCLNLCRRASSAGAARVIAVSWPDFAQEASGFVEDCIPFYVRPKEVRQSILSKYGSMGTLSNETLDRIQDDLQLLRILIDVAGALGPTPVSTDDIAKAYWEKRLGTLAGDSQIRRIVLTVATLGRYDVPLPLNFVESEARVKGQEVEALVSSGVIRVSRDSSLWATGHFPLYWPIGSLTKVSGRSSRKSVGLKIHLHWSEIICGTHPPRWRLKRFGPSMRERVSNSPTNLIAIPQHLWLLGARSTRYWNESNISRRRTLSGAGYSRQSCSSPSLLPTWVVPQRRLRASPSCDRDTK